MRRYGCSSSPERSQPCNRSRNTSCADRRMSWRTHPVLAGSRTSVARAVGVDPAPPKRNKYGARVTWLDGIRFAAQREADRYSQLRLLELAGKITALQTQPKYELR